MRMRERCQGDSREGGVEPMSQTVPFGKQAAALPSWLLPNTRVPGRYTLQLRIHITSLVPRSKACHLFLGLSSPLGSPRFPISESEHTW